MKAAPGGELACRARSHRFQQYGREVERGVISYYASETLPRATTVSSWAALMERAASADVARGQLAASHVPALQVAGDGGLRVPGVPVAAAGSWFVLSRSEGCVALDVLARGDRLPRAPTSPEDYAELMRAQGHQPTLGLPPGFPPALSGKVVMVKVRDDRAPVFVRDEVCRQMKTH